MPAKGKTDGYGAKYGTYAGQTVEICALEGKYWPSDRCHKVTPAVRSSTHGMRAAQDPSDLVGNFQRSPRQNDDGTCYTNHLLAVSFSLTFKLYL